MAWVLRAGEARRQAALQDTKRLSWNIENNDHARV
jgi:hypothetical protein